MSHFSNLLGFTGYLFRGALIDPALHRPMTLMSYRIKKLFQDRFVPGVHDDLNGNHEQGCLTEGLIVQDEPFCEHHGSEKEPYQSQRDHCNGIVTTPRNPSTAPSVSFLCSPAV